MSVAPRRVLYDGSAFMRHRRSGITRYFAEMIGEFCRDPALGVEPVTPYRYVANEHLVRAVPGRFRQLPLPPQLRDRAFDRLNRRHDAGPEPDIVHHVLYEPAALSALRGRRRVCTVYDFTIELGLVPGATGAGLPLKKQVLEACDAIFCISHTTAADLARFHPHLDKPVVVTELGVADGFFSPRVRVPHLPERYVLHVGHRFGHKNVDLLYRAFAEVSRRQPDLHLVICGRAAPDERARLAELGIAERTVVLDPDDDQLASVYHRAALLCFPSRYEGFGLPVVEAMAAGCPVVVADTPTLVEVAGDAAVVVGPDDVDGLAARIEEILADGAVADQLRERGRQRARDYSWRRTAERTARAYDLAFASSDADKRKA